MFEALELTRMAQSLASHQGARMSVIAENVANADTPGYQARDVVDFAAVYGEETRMRATRPGHLDFQPPAGGPVPVVSGESEAPNGNSVSLEMEMVKSADARQMHEMALAVYRATTGVIRTSLGRS